jgi:hypothetical protein
MIAVYSSRIDDHLQRQPVQPRGAHAVVLDVILPCILAVSDFGQKLMAIDVAALVKDRLKARLNRMGTETREQVAHAPRAHQTGLNLAIEIGGKHGGNSGVALDNG